MPAIPHNIPPKIIAITTASALIFTFDPIIIGVKILFSINKLNVKTQATPTAYHRESLVNNATIIAKALPIIVPIYDMIINNAAS